MAPTDKPPDDADPFAHLYLTTQLESRLRSEAAMPGTAGITPLLALVPPTPVSDDKNNYYGPDAIVEFSVVVPARQTFAVADLAAQISPELTHTWATPVLYVSPPGEGNTYMFSTDAPEIANGIAAGWNLSDSAEDTVDAIHAGVIDFLTWLATRQENFAAVTVNRVDIANRYRLAQKIIAIEPSDVSILALPKGDQGKFDGKQVWRVLHALGIDWGDMDQFQWPDPTGQSDYLFWAEVGEYAMPEDIAAGRQHFEHVNFHFDIARSPDPAHVLGQMARAAEVFAQHLAGELTFHVDDEPVDGLRELEAAIADVVGQLRACGVEPGSSSVCILR